MRKELLCTVFMVTILASMIPAVMVKATDTGWTSPTATWPKTGGTKFEHAERAFKDDEKAAFAKEGDSQLYFNFGFSIPTGATITGIEVRLDAWIHNLKDAEDGEFTVKLSGDGGTSYTASETTGPLTGSELTYYLGGDDYTWGRTWTAAEFSDVNFRVEVGASANFEGNRLRLDYLAVKVYYGSPGGPVEGVTRTQGFWATHPTYTCTVWSGITDKTIGTHTIDNDAKLMGAFWSSIAKKSDDTRRTPLDQARMQLLQQLVAAMLNVQAFGADDEGLIAAGKAAFSGTDRASILDIASQLAAFNESGENLSLPPGVSPGRADPQGAQEMADKGFWDSLP